jgi:hypothetical protein
MTLSFVNEIIVEMRPQDRERISWLDNKAVL